MSILLKSQVESLVVTTSGTSELSYSVMMDVFGKQEFETSSEGLITTATTTTIALPPSPNFYNSINAIFLVNNGVGSQTIDVIKVINGVEHPMFSTAVILEAGETLQYNKNAGWLKLNASGEPMSSAGVSNGDKGDITVSNSGTTWTLNDGVVTPAKTTITGTPDGTKYLKDDWTWATVPPSATLVPYTGATSDLDLAKKALILQASNDARFAITISNIGDLVITPL